MKLKRPDRIAICFVDGNKERSLLQVEQLKGVEDDFEIEWNFRSDKFTGSYSNFSQLINEAVVETESEFMVFINPKTIVSREDITIMIDDLCNGYAWSSVCSFGLWSTTKELFRRIGMMDERFIGSEWEDNDFGLRMSQFGKAISWRFELEKYPWRKPILPQMRGLTQSLFKLKWMLIDGVYYRTDRFREEKLLPKKILESERRDIYDSWMEWEESQTDMVSHVARQAVTAKVSNQILKTQREKANSRINIRNENGEIHIEFLCSVATEIHIAITNALPVGEERMVLDYIIPMQSNTYYRIGIEKGQYELRFFHEDRLIIHDSLYTFPGNRSFDLGLTITKNIETGAQGITQR